MKILVISDIHAFVKDRENGHKPSYVNANDLSPSAPTVLFEEMLKNGKIPKPDVVVSPGDLGDRADPTAINFAWNFLTSLTRLSNNGLLLASAGNHDIDSRYQNTEFDAKGMLLNLRPSYPTVSGLNGDSRGDDDRQLMFWARNFYIARCGSCRFVVLNSCAYHGGGRDKEEFLHGRISADTLHRIDSALAADRAQQENRGEQAPLISVFLCHHHLEKDGTIDDPDYSQMKGAHTLVDFFSNTNTGRWLVIHGHRHRARLFQAGGSTGPIVLSAASFGATRDLDYDNTSPNQAHLIELDFQGMNAHAFYPAGRIQSWTWTPGVGWLSEGAPSGGLPPSTGFGFRGSIDQIARKINGIVTNLPRRWHELVSAQPELAYFDWIQLQHLKKILTDTHKITLIMSEDRSPLECGRLP